MEGVVDAEERLPDRDGARSRFVAGLGRRLDTLRNALGALREESGSAAHRDNLRRRMHATTATARVLGFETTAEAMAAAERALAKPAQRGQLDPKVLDDVARTLDLLPSLVFGAADFVAPVALANAAETGGERTWPISVVALGSESLAQALTAAGAPSTGPDIECEVTRDAAEARELVAALAPDVVIVDNDVGGARDLVEAVVGDPMIQPAAIVVLGNFDRPEAAAALVALGVTRVLPKPVSPDALVRTINELARSGASPFVRVEALGDLNIEGLVQRLSTELRRGLIDAVEAGGRSVEVPLGEGADVLAATWSAVARIRDLVTLRSGGAVRFASAGPEGAIPLAPWMGSSQARTTGGRARDDSAVSLEGRRIVVADDDPAVVWFMAGLFRAAGAQVLEAHDGEQALELVHRNWPDLVVSDILMPKLDGFALCRQLKADIALSDVPVVLLSWKEDLLQRMRELGADADAYLRKEATASTVVRRAKEVLRARARIEGRLARDGALRGRLDGLTPRLVLQLVCAAKASATVAIRDAAYLYEVHVRDGLPLRAVRTDLEGRSQSGDVVLGALLGVRAGRFAVSHASDDCEDELGGDLMAVLAPHILKARSAQRLLTREGLADIERVDVDLAAMERYLEASPGPARGLVERVAGGQSPAELAELPRGGELLPLVLADLVRHGAVTGIFGDGGVDLLARALEAASGTPEAALEFSDLLTPSSEVVLEPASPEEAQAQLDPALPPIEDRATAPGPAPRPIDAFGDPWDRRATEPNVPAGASAEPAAVHESTAAPSSGSPSSTSELDRSWTDSIMPAALPAEPERTPPSSRAALSRRAAPSLSRDASPLEASLQDAKLADSVRAMAAVVPPADEAEASRGVDSRLAAPGAPAVRKIDIPRPGRATGGAAPARDPETNRTDLDLADAVLGQMLSSDDDEPESPAAFQAETLGAPPSDDVGDASARTGEPGVSPRDADADPAESVEASPSPPGASPTESDSGTAVAAPPGGRTMLGPAPLGLRPPVSPGAEPETADEVAAPALGALVAALTETPAGEAQFDASRGNADPAQDVVELLVEPPRREAPGASEVDPLPLPSDPGEAPDAGLRQDVPRLSGPPVSRRSPGVETRPITFPRPTPPSDEASDVADRDTDPPSRSLAPPRVGSRSGSMVLAGALCVGAAVIAFMATRAAVFVGDGAPTAAVSAERPASVPPATATAAPSALPTAEAAATVSDPEAAPSPAGAGPAGGPLSFALTDADLPSGLGVADGNGLLEISSGERHKIYVGGVFVGRGPIRRVPIKAGKHDVRLELGGQESETVVDVRSGRMTRLVARAAKP